MVSVNTSLDELDTYIAAGVAPMQFAWRLPKQTTLEFGIRLMVYGILAGGFDLNIFYFICMKRDWAEHRCYVIALS